MYLVDPAASSPRCVHGYGVCGYRVLTPDLRLTIDVGTTFSGTTRCGVRCVAASMFASKFEVLLHRFFFEFFLLKTARRRNA